MHDIIRIVNNKINCFVLKTKVLEKEILTLLFLFCRFSVVLLSTSKQLRSYPGIFYSTRPAVIYKTIDSTRPDPTCGSTRSVDISKQSTHRGTAYQFRIIRYAVENSRKLNKFCR